MRADLLRFRALHREVVKRQTEDRRQDVQMDKEEQRRPDVAGEFRSRRRQVNSEDSLMIDFLKIILFKLSFLI